MPALGFPICPTCSAWSSFTKACRGNGIKPVIGCDVWIENETDRDKAIPYLPICHNRAGYGRLCGIKLDRRATAPK